MRCGHPVLRARDDAQCLSLLPFTGPGATPSRPPRSTLGGQGRWTLLEY
ncbi:hypothetical protein SGM_0146 [Streptomyces griseoaurantiacus M045]|uniref:Uncharacterized protein n=1 Tax=Streptomyces griseoaurantiacus M045 TaxID=996637 RepID=F3N9W2_9ACTN|nr:hypothetical protein SGM_0146 [Streptomyces griseoaurantiacus M045]